MFYIGTRSEKCIDSQSPTTIREKLAIITLFLPLFSASLVYSASYSVVNYNMYLSFLRLCDFLSTFSSWSDRRRSAIGKSGFRSLRKRFAFWKLVDFLKSLIETILSVEFAPLGFILRRKCSMLSAPCRVVSFRER